MKSKKNLLVYKIYSGLILDVLREVDNFVSVNQICLLMQKKIAKDFDATIEEINKPHYYIVTELIEQYVENKEIIKKEKVCARGSTGYKLNKC